MNISAKERATAAALLQMSEQYLYQWLTGRRLADPDRCPEVERAFEGRVSCEDLRSDLQWLRIADPAWPWHPGGRPVHDVGARALRIAFPAERCQADWQSHSACRPSIPVSATPAPQKAGYAG